MRSRARGAALIGLVVAAALAGQARAAAPRKPAADAPGALAGAAVKERVDALLRQMTLEEKVGQLTQAPGIPLPGWSALDELLRQGGAGSVLWISDTKRLNELQRIAVEQSRLKIPVLYGFDVLHGYRTVFPVPLAMASSWDPSLHERAAAVAAREARAAGIHWTFAPMVDVARDARWGRIVEGAGEDPYLGSAMAAAQVRGFQGEDIGSADRVLACVKHFAAYGAGDGGRDYDPVYVPEGRLRNVYFPPFAAAVKAGVGSVMSTYVDLNDVPAAGNRWLLHDVLRGEWGFSGFVVSDAFAVGNLVVQGFAADGNAATRRALAAGLDMDMVSGMYPKSLAALVRAGKVRQEELDEAVARILAVKVRLGLFEHPYADESRATAVAADPSHREAARLAAQRSMVLLRNQGGLLPLPRTLSKVAVIGPLADSRADTEGPWTVFAELPTAVTVLEGIRAKLPSAHVTHAPGPQIRREVPSFLEDFTPWMRRPVQPPEEAEAAFREAVGAARGADLVVAVMGELATMTGEAASRASLDLPGRQEELLRAVHALGKPIVLVLINGRPLSIRWAAENVPAILEAWHPGTEGGNAVADVLFGDVAPGGKLPVTFPRHAAHAPIYYARVATQEPEYDWKYRSRYWDGPTTPLYPFGFGLSYTTFSFSRLAVGSPKVKVGATVTVTAEVTNTGTRRGDEVAQLYIHQRAGSDSRPMRELRGFQRLTLEPGEKRTVTFTLGPEELGYWSTSQGRQVQDVSMFDVWVGGDSTAGLHRELEVVP